MTLGRFQDDTLTVFNSFNDHLREGNVGEFEFALVLLFFEANVENINRAAERANADLGAVGFPSD